MAGVNLRAGFLDARAEPVEHRAKRVVGPRERAQILAQTDHAALSGLEVCTDRTERGIGALAAFQNTVGVGDDIGRLIANRGDCVTERGDIAGNAPG